MKMTTQKRALDKIYKRRDRYEIPDWQREEVWGTKKRQKLIDSILRGWRLPKFYFLKTSANEYEVVDGQQRLATIYEFLDDELELPISAGKMFGGVKYSELTEEFSDAFDDFEIDIDEIEDAPDEDIREFFQRLQEGFPLSSSEKLNAINSKLRTFAKMLTKNPFFEETVLFKDKRYAHFDVAAKSIAIEVEGLDAGFRYEDLKKVFESNKTFSTTSKTAKTLVKALAFLHKALGVSSPILRNRSLAQSIINIACRLVECGINEGQAKSFGKFLEQFSINLSKQVELGHAATDPSMIQFQRTVNANVRSGPKTRNTILLRKLFEFDPHFADGFSALAVKLSEIDIEISRLGSVIQKLVEEINSAEASQTGKDLFKATNKTTGAAAAIKKPAVNYEEYKSLIENLYFIFWEGPGSKLEGRQPRSFKDINILRTNLQHDVDHGAALKVKNKNKEFGSVFNSYAGVSAPSLASPERFPIVHMKLLIKLENDLRILKDSYTTSVS